MEARKKADSNTGHLLGNRKVAKSRGEGWKKNLVRGKHEARLNPSSLMLKRLKRSISQAEIAGQIGVSPASYGAIERAKRLVSEKRARVIAQKMGMRLSELFAKASKDSKKYLATLNFRGV